MLDILKKAFRNGSFDLLIKGKPGVGKTLLALTLIKDNIPGVYISTRVALAELKNYVPWIIDLIKKKMLYDASFSQFTSERVAQRDTKIEFNRLTMFLEKVYEVVVRFIDQVDSKSNSVRPVCIIDSIDAIKEFFDVQTHIIEKTLLEIGANNQVNMIFITERDQETSLDFLVDGIIKLRMDIEDEFIIRKVIIKKMRGIEIKRPINYFTITKMGIKFLEPMRSDVVSYADLKFHKTTNTLKFSSGIPDFDAILDGGFLRGSSILVNVSPNVPIYIPAYFMDMIGLNMMHNNIPWYFMSSFQATGETLEVWLKRFFPKDLIEQYFRPIYIKESKQFTGKQEQDNKFEFFIKKSGVVDTSLAKVIEGDLKKNTFKSAYVSLALDSLISQLGHSTTHKVIAEMDMYLRKIHSLVAYFTFSNEENGPKVPWANYYLKFRNKGGLGLLSIEKPIKEGLFVIHFDWKATGSKIKLIKIR